MRSSRFPLIVGIVSLLAMPAIAFLFPELGGAESPVWYAAGTIYVLTLLLGGSAWYWWTRSLDFQKTAGIAAIVVVVLTPAIPLLIELGNLQYTLNPLAHLEWFVPIAFMFPLGAAMRRRQQIGTIAIMILPSMYTLLDWLVLKPLQPGGFDPILLTPLTFAFSIGVSSLFLATLGAPLFLLGHQITRNDPPQHSSFQRDSLNSG